MSNVEKGCSPHPWIGLKEYTLNRNVPISVSSLRLVRAQIFVAATVLSDMMAIVSD